MLLYIKQRTMNPVLTDFLASRTPLVEESALWGDLLPLHITFYLSSEQPPLQFVTSVRSVVFQADSVLVVRDAENHFHITPGGRREQNETIEETLRREVLEETGWTLSEISLLGFTHFHNLAPRPSNYTYPHPDFLQIIYVAQADKYIPEAQVPGEYELETDFRPIGEVRRLLLEPGQLMLLNAAIEFRQSLE